MNKLLKGQFIILCFVFLAGCGYSPMYSTSSNQSINIEITSYEGDAYINSILRSRLLIHQNNENVKLFKIKINTIYEKTDLAKDAAGNTENYELKVTSIFIVTRGEFSKTITISEKFIMENLSDDFEEKNYEKKIKENFSSSIYQKLISQILQIK